MIKSLKMIWHDLIVNLQNMTKEMSILKEMSIFESVRVLLVFLSIIIFLMPALLIRHKGTEGEAFLFCGVAWMFVALLYSYAVCQGKCEC